MFFSGRFAAWSRGEGIILEERPARREKSNAIQGKDISRSGTTEPGPYRVLPPLAKAVQKAFWKMPGWEVGGFDEFPRLKKK